MPEARFLIRKPTLNDLDTWAEMRHQLWPSESKAGHRTEIEDWIAQAENAAFVAESSDGHLIGFCEASIRPYANGCESSPVPFAEGMWVSEGFRRQGVGESLIRALESWALDSGFKDIGSDAELDNKVSQAAHFAWGFQETERVVYFKKSL